MEGYTETKRNTIRIMNKTIKPLPKNIAKRVLLKKLPAKIKDIKNILNIPFNKKEYNNNIIKSILYTNYTTNYDENLILLRKYIEKEKDGEFKEYYKYLHEIRTHLLNYDIYEIIKETKDDYSEEYYEELRNIMSSYDPLYINGETLIKFKNILLSNKCITLYNSIIIYEFKKAIIHYTHERVTKNTLKNKLNANILTYNVIQFIANIINNLYLPLLHRNILDEVELINILADKHDNIIIDNPHLDISNSLPNSSSLTTDSYLRGKRTNDRDLYIQYLHNNRGYNNEINEEDFITFEIWRDMSLSKLRHVIKIAYVENNKNFCHAFNSKSLYKLWKIKENKGELFKNPYSQKPFTENDKLTILKTLGKRDFRYDEDYDVSVVNTRHDIKLKISNIKIDGEDYWHIAISYEYFIGYIKNKLKNEILELVKINISALMMNIDILLKKIGLLYRDNKILGKLLPFTIHPAITKYNFKTIADDDTYKDFYNMIFEN